MKATLTTMNLMNIERWSRTQSIVKAVKRFLRELAEAMDAMPEKKLISEALVTRQGDCCTLGVICKKRNIDISDVDADDPEDVGFTLGIDYSMAAEIAYENDEGGPWGVDEDPELRWQRMRKWVDAHILPTS